MPFHNGKPPWELWEGTNLNALFHADAADDDGVHLRITRLLELWYNVKRFFFIFNFYFYCYTVHVVELLNYYTNHCTYIKFIKFTH